MSQIKTYYCEDCIKNGNDKPRELGEFSAMRSLENHGRIICGDCAQKENPVYQEWLEDQKRIKEIQIEAV